MIGAATMMSMAQRSDAPQDSTEAPGVSGERLTHFSERSPILVTVSASIVVAGLVFIGWTTAPEGKRSAAHLHRVLFDLGRIITENGWAIIALSVSLVAIVVTIITIIGLRDPETDPARRRDVVMRIADTLMLTALGLLAGILVSVICSYLAISWRATVLERYIPSTDLFTIFATALLLWFVFSSLYRRLRDIALSDAERREEDLKVLARQKRHLEKQKVIAGEQLSGRERVENEHDPDSGVTRPDATPRKTAGMTVGWSALWILVAAVAAVIVLWGQWVQSDERLELQDFLTRTVEVLLRVMLMAAIQMVVVVVSYLWSIQHLRSGDPGWKGKLKAFGSFLFTTPMTVLFPLAALIGIFSPDIDRPVLLRIVLSVLVFAPLLLSFLLPRRWNWRRVSWSYASQQITRRLAQIEARIDDVEAEKAASAKRGDHPSDNERIIELLEQLVAAGTASTSSTPQHGSLFRTFWASLKRRE